VITAKQQALSTNIEQQTKRIKSW